MSGPLRLRQEQRIARYRRAMARQRMLSAATYIGGCGALAFLGITILWVLTLYWGVALS